MLAADARPELAAGVTAHGAAQRPAAAPQTVGDGATRDAPECKGRCAPRMTFIDTELSGVHIQIIGQLCVVIDRSLDVDKMGAFFRSIANRPIFSCRNTSHKYYNGIDSALSC